MNADDVGIWAPYEAFYIQAMLFDTRSAVGSIERVSRLISKLSQDSCHDSLRSLSTNALLDDLQNIIVRAAALSRYFWPARQGHEARAQQLRQAFHITDGNPLRNRELRNEIEHFDEKLDAYLAPGIAGYILPGYVGALPEDADVPTHVFRAYYLDVGVFEVLGKRYELEPIANEILRIHDLLLSCDACGGRLTPEKLN